MTAARAAHAPRTRCAGAAQRCAGAAERCACAAHAAARAAPEADQSSCAAAPRVLLESAWYLVVICERAFPCADYLWTLLETHIFKRVHIHVDPFGNRP